MESDNQKQPAPIEPSPTQVETEESSRRQASKRTKLALLFMVGPTALLILTIIGYAIVNFIFSTVSPSSGGISTTVGSSPIGYILNILLFLSGIIVVLTWLPGMIAGIVLLTSKNKA